MDVDVDEVRQALLQRAAHIANKHAELPPYLMEVGDLFIIPRDPKRWALEFFDPFIVPHAVEAAKQEMETVLPILTRIVKQSIRQAIHENPNAIGFIIVEAMRTDQDPWNAYTS